MGRLELISDYRPRAIEKLFAGLAAERGHQILMA